MVDRPEEKAIYSTSRPLSRSLPMVSSKVPTLMAEVVASAPSRSRL